MIRDLARKLVRRARAVACEAREYTAFMLLKRRREVAVLIFAQGRTGSTLLESMLTGSGHFVGKGEVLGKGWSRVRFPLAYIRGLAKRHAPRNFVAHLKIYHLTEDRENAGASRVDPGLFLRELVANGWRIIYLRRADPVRQFISTEVANARGHYHKFDDRPETTLVTIDRERLIETVQWRDKIHEEERRALEGIEHLEIVYERDLLDPERHQATLDRTLDYLGLERSPAKTRLRKLNARPLREVIANYDEFAGWAKELGWTDDDEVDSSAEQMGQPATTRERPLRQGA
jgi:LPS sulfotransferase NodH